MNGKILRLDPNTGAGAPGNPFFTAGVNPYSARARVYALGFRNPYRWSMKPGTNTLYVGDVGLGSWDELTIVKAGQNHGWPFFEGNVQPPQYPGNPHNIARPTNPTFPKFVWRQASKVYVNGGTAFTVCVWLSPKYHHTHSCCCCCLSFSLPLL